MSAKFQHKGERDLFEQFQGGDVNLRKKTRFILPRLRKSVEFSYENVIFLAIAFIMSSLIFFSLGVEKGRREKAQTSLEREEKTIRSETVEQIAEKEDERPEPQKPAVRRPRGGYVIQLAAFTNAASAEEEASNLKREGYPAEIKKSGSYYQVFLGGFADRKEAEGVLRNLSGRYGDGYIKKQIEED